MGVFPYRRFFLSYLNGLPHARGGVSAYCLGQPGGERSSPRPWGCFYTFGNHQSKAKVFPTPVGVFPDFDASKTLTKSLPHARGGVSRKCKQCGGEPVSSPRPWGCFLNGLRGTAEVLVFPTPVGVFPSIPRFAFVFGSLPHARGGVSGPICRAGRKAASSPRPWGCFHGSQGRLHPHPVFPTPVGVFPQNGFQRVMPGGLPHARGGVSVSERQIYDYIASSPRPWGCFQMLKFKARPLRHLTAQMKGAYAFAAVACSAVG